MKTIKSLKDVTTLEVGDVVVFGKLEHTIVLGRYGYYLSPSNFCSSNIFNKLNLSKVKFVESLGISICYVGAFPEVKSLEALTAIVSALFKEYEKQKELPKTWEEFCERNPLKEEETFINSASKPITIGDYIERRYRIPDKDKNLCISEQEAKSFLALMQLRQLRKAYVGNWEPDWRSDKSKYCIEVTNNNLEIHSWYHNSHILSFPNCKLAEQFLTNFKDLLEIAKPLL